MSASDANCSTVYPKALNYILRVVTSGFPVGDNPTIVPTVQFFKNVLPLAVAAVYC